MQKSGQPAAADVDIAADADAAVAAATADADVTAVSSVVLNHPFCHAPFLSHQTCPPTLPHSLRVNAVPLLLVR